MCSCNLDQAGRCCWCCCTLPSFKLCSIISTLCVFALIIASGVAINIGNRNLVYCGDDGSSLPNTPTGVLACQIYCSPGSRPGDFTNSCFYFKGSEIFFFGAAIFICLIIIAQNVYWLIINNITKKNPSRSLYYPFWFVSIVALVCLLGFWLFSLIFIFILKPIQGPSIAMNLFSAGAFITQTGIVHIIRVKYKTANFLPNNNGFAQNIPYAQPANNNQLYYPLTTPV